MTVTRSWHNAVIVATNNAIFFLLRRQCDAILTQPIILLLMRLMRLQLLPPPANPSTQLLDFLGRFPVLWCWFNAQAIQPIVYRAKQLCWTVRFLHLHFCSLLMAGVCKNDGACVVLNATCLGTSVLVSNFKWKEDCRPSYFQDTRENCSQIPSALVHLSFKRQNIIHLAQHDKEW